MAADCGLTLIRSHGRGEDTVDSSGRGEVRGGDPGRIGTAGSPVPRVSIVTPAFNRLDYTRRCLESVEHLTYPNFETLLVDNGSADGTADSVRQEFPWVRVFRNEVNVGYAAGCNGGIRESRGDYILVLNNDTKVVDSHLLDVLVAAIEANPTLAGGDPRLGDYVNYGKVRVEGGPDAYGDHELTGSAPMFRPEGLHEVGLFAAVYFSFWRDPALFALV